MIYSKKIIIQLLSEILIQFKIKNIILSPGSRNAPFFIHCVSNPYFHCYNIIDERSAGFIALGMSQSTKKPTVLCCTSGSASVNYYPSIVEAFYQNIPLLIITADRPKKYIDIFDGQTIRQNKIFKKHSYGNFELSEITSHQMYVHNYKIIKQAILICYNKKGPVHINLPLFEPLYEITTRNKILIDKIIIKKKNIHKKINWISIKNIWMQSKKIMFLCGMQDTTKDIEKQLILLQKKNKTVIVLCESTSNLKSPKFIQHIDSIIFNLNQHQINILSPDLLITIGQNVISKKIKLFLRNSHIKNHWHLDNNWFPNTYFCLTKKINLSTTFFLNELINKIPVNNIFKYQKIWIQLEKKRILNHINFIKKISFSDLKVYDILSKKIPKKYIIQFGNSCAIRYAQIFNFYKFKSIFCNRGVSGIDGSTSTAIGFSIKSKNPVIIILGDLSFFYDVNALWNQYIPSNFRLILINNFGGDIFKFINPLIPNKLLENFFIAKHNKNAKKIAEHFNIKYYSTSNYNQLIKILNIFFVTSKKPKILEINTSAISNSMILNNYMKSMKYF